MHVKYAFRDRLCIRTTLNIWQTLGGIGILEGINKIYLRELRNQHISNHFFNPIIKFRHWIRVVIYFGNFFLDRLNMFSGRFCKLKQKGKINALLIKQMTYWTNFWSQVLHTQLYEYFRNFRMRILNLESNTFTNLMCYTNTTQRINL